MTEEQFLKIPISKIVCSPFNIREGSDLSELAESIREQGVIEPIIVRKIEEDKFELVAGERRFNASKTAGLKEIPALIRTLNDEQAFTVLSTENLHRHDLTETEKTALVTFCAEHFHKKPKEIGQQLGMSLNWVLKYLPDKFKDQNKAESGSLGGTAKAEGATRRVADFLSNQEPGNTEIESTYLEAPITEIDAVPIEPVTAPLLVEPSTAEQVADSLIAGTITIKAMLPPGFSAIKADALLDIIRTHYRDMQDIDVGADKNGNIILFTLNRSDYDAVLDVISHRDEKEATFETLADDLREAWLDSGLTMTALCQITFCFANEKDDVAITPKPLIPGEPTYIDQMPKCQGCGRRFLVYELEGGLCVHCRTPKTETKPAAKLAKSNPR